MMKTKTYQINIKAPVAQVFYKMLDRPTYKLWTAEFQPTSDYEGGWNKGDKIYFIGINKEGKREGMIAKIAEHIPNKFISIAHYGILDGDTEILEGPAVEGWTGCTENYHFEEQDDVTTVTVKLDVMDQYLTYFDETWPKALARLKQICE